MAQDLSLWGILTSPYLFQDALFYRPVVNISFTLPIMLGFDSLKSQFILNILIHAINSFLLYQLLMRFGLKKDKSLLLSVLFVIHSAVTNSVAWLPGRNDSLLMMFIMLSMIYYDRYLENGNYKYLLLNVFFLFISLFTKETALIGAVVFAVYFYIKKSKKVNSLLYSAAGWVIVIIIWHFIRSDFVSGYGEFEYLKNLPFIVQAVGKSILPFNLSVLPTIEDTSFLYGTASIVLLISGLLFSRSKDLFLILFGAMWFLAFLLPSLLNINPEYNQNLMLESRLYLPLAGIMIIISQVNFFKASEYPRFAGLILVVIICVFCYLNVRAALNYSNENVFWENAVSKSPSLDLSFSGLGLINLQKGNYEKSAECYKQAAKLNTFKADYNKKAGLSLLNLNKADEAEYFFRKEMAINPNDFDCNLLTGIICFKTARLEDSEKFLLSAYKINDKDFQPPLYLIKVYSQEKRYSDAYKYAEILKSRGYKLPEDVARELYPNY